MKAGPFFRVTINISDDPDRMKVLPKLTEDQAANVDRVFFGDMLKQLVLNDRSPARNVPALVVEPLSRITLDLKTGKVTTHPPLPDEKGGVA